MPPTTPIRPRRAVEMRQEGRTWREIAVALGYKSTASAQNSVRETAAAHGWALDVRKARNAGDGNGHEAYTMRQSGAAWGEIARLLGYASESGACNATRGWAERNGRAWPVEVIDG